MDAGSSNEHSHGGPATSTESHWNKVVNPATAASEASNGQDEDGITTMDEPDMLIARAVMAYLKTKDPAVFEKAKAAIAKTNDIDACLRKPIRKREMVQLKAIVGQVYWQRAEKHLESHFQIAKENKQANPKLPCNRQPISALETSSARELYPDFAQTLLNYLETQNKALSKEAKAIINDCVAMHQPSHAYDSLVTTMKERLKPVVGDFYWKQAETLHSQGSNQPLAEKEYPVSATKEQVPAASPILSGQKRKAPTPYYVPSPLTTNIHGHADTSTEFWLGLSQQLPRAVTNPNEGPSDDGSATSTNDPFEPTPVDQLRDMPQEEWDNESSATSLDGFGFGS